MINNKGQAFSVFKILIAAIVALAVLGLLMNIMGLIDFNPSNEPETAAKELVKTAYSNQFSLKSKVVTFDEEHNIIIPEHITKSGGAPLAPEQVCFCTPIAGSLTQFNGSGCGGQLTYGDGQSGLNEREVTLYVVCSDSGVPQAYSETFGGCGASAGDISCYITVGPKK